MAYSKTPRTLWHGLAGGALAALLVACGGGGSGDDSNAGSGGGSGGGGGGGGAPAATSLQVLPQRLGLAIGDDAALLAAGATEATTWQSSDATVALVDPTGRVQALARGSAVITATSGTSVAASTVTVYQTTGPNADPTSEARIADALAKHTIDAETALLYRVFSLFGDERLPLAFDGAPSKTPQHPLLRELMTTVDSLSPAAQDVLRPFLRPPIYADSWYARRLGLTASAAVQASTTRKHVLATSFACAVANAPTLYGTVSTQHFAVHYLSLGGAAFADINAKAAAMAALVASLVEDIYTAEIRLIDPLDRLDDSKEACNGGSAKYDIYYGPAALSGLAAWTSTFELAPDLRATKSKCALRPSFMMLNSVSAEFRAAEAQLTNATLMVKSLLAHEFLHALQFTMDRKASCADVEWIDEATAQWAMDYLVPTIPQGAPGEFGMEPGLGSVAGNYAKSGTVLATYLYAGHLVSIEKPGAEIDPKWNGYSDYLFFQFLARTQGADTIRQIFSAMASGRNSVESIGAAVDMKAVWPEFAKSLWMGWEDQVLDYWPKEDEYRFGLAQVYAQVPTNADIPQSLKDRQRSIKVDLKSEGTSQFPLLDAALAFSSNYEIEPRSILFEHLKFSDDTADAVIFYNPIAGRDDASFLKVQALKKVAGTWQAPEDWTNDTFKTWCRDKQDERLEELLLVISNSETNRASETAFVIGQQSPMKLATANVGCWKWHGSASLTTQTVFGYTTVETMVGDFIRFRDLSPNPADALVGLDMFVSDTASAITYDISGPISGTNCTISGHGTSVQGTADAGSMFINYLTLDGPPTPLDRKVIGGGVSVVPGLRKTISCPGQAPTLSDVDTSTNWLSLPTDGIPISSDGRTISGSWTRTDGEGTKTSVWHFTAVRE